MKEKCSNANIFLSPRREYNVMDQGSFESGREFQMPLTVVAAERANVHMRCIYQH